MNRSVVDAYDIQDNTPIYFNGSALLTATSDGSNIEQKLKEIEDRNVIHLLNIVSDTTELIISDNIEFLTWETLNANIDLNELKSLV